VVCIGTGKHLLCIVTEPGWLSQYSDWATVWTTGARFPAGTYLFDIASRPLLGPTQPPTEWVPRALSPAVKRTGREANNSLPSIAEVKEWVELYIHFPNTPSWRGACLKQYANNMLVLNVLFNWIFNYLFCVNSVISLLNREAMQKRDYSHEFFRLSAHKRNPLFLTRSS
jgi:hypothetical protein